MGSPNLPPQNIPLDAPPSSSNRAAPEVLMPAPMPPGTSGYTPAPAQRGSVVLGEPEFEAVLTPQPDPKRAAVKPPPLAAIDEEPASTLPVGIANYEVVKDGVSSGFRPNLDGLDWLKASKVKSVLFLREANEDDSSDRRQIEMRGMIYHSLVITAETINASTIEDFKRLVNTSEGRPIFVYDRNGIKAGAMWYLYFRNADMLGDEEARLRAGRLGLKAAGDAEQTALWTAVQKYLAGKNP